MPSSLLFAINNEGRVYCISTTGTKWREFVYLGLEFKYISAVPHFIWAIGGDRQVYVHVYGLEIPIRIKEESYENERWLPLEGFSGRLLPTDRYHFSNQEGTCDRSFDKIRLPSLAWQWEGDWHLENSLDGQPLDHDGWSYAIDFPATYYPKKQWKSCVRRRKWIRYRRYSALNSWCAIAPLHKDPTQEPFIHVSIGGNNIPGGDPSNLSVWAITAHGRVMFRTGVSKTSPEGQRWTSIPVPSNNEVTHISVGPTGLLWAILWNGKAIIRTGITRDSITGDGWHEIGPPSENRKLIQVSVGTNSVWCLTDDQHVWFRKGIRGECAGTNLDMAMGTGWVEMVGRMALISVASNDQVFAVGLEDRCTYFRTGILPSELTGRTWRILQAPMHLSRTGSTASLWSLNSKNKEKDKNQRVKSWAPMSKNQLLALSVCASSATPNAGTGSTYLQDWAETSRSAPTPNSLRLKPSHWQRPLSDCSTANSASNGSEESVTDSETGGQNLNRTDSTESSSECIQAAQAASIEEHTETSGRNRRRRPTVWSPVRSVGSIVGAEAHPEADGSVFDGVDSTNGVFIAEDDDSGLAAVCWGDFEDVTWSCVEAGACLIDPISRPNWFIENKSSPNKELKKPWRMKILEELQLRISQDQIIKFKAYEKAIDMGSWVKIGEAQYSLKDHPGSLLEECIIELEWINDDQTGGTFTILTLDRAETKAQISLRDIVCVQCCSEPARPRIAIHCPAGTSSRFITLQFTGDTDKEDWMANLTSVCCQVNQVNGAPSPSSTWMTTSLGDVFVFDPTSIEANQILESNEYINDLDVIGKHAPYELPITNGFGPHTKIQLIGCIHDDTQRFAINLCSGSQDVIFHINPRFESSPPIFVRNTKSNGSWGTEEREGPPLTLSPGSTFILEILSHDKGYTILIDNNNLYEYHHRLRPENVTHISVEGGITLQQAVYTSPKVIIEPREMFWRQMGGHLRKVETCSEGITWGLGYDNTPYVYTGGWGGAFLKGLETSSSGIHPMRDTHACYVYENQRWNPVTGYTSHGLPTDRYMWSDITGRHRRTREHTKLLSMHWQWISEWCVDYNTPGGVDKEGWQYAIDFPGTYHGKKQFTDYVRRRRWVRRCQLTTSGPWHELTGDTKLLDLSLHSEEDGNIITWAVASNGDAVFRQGVSSNCPSGQNWDHVPTDQPLSGISVGINNQVWAVGRNGSAFWRFGISKNNPIGEIWESVEPPPGKILKQISVGRWGIWTLDGQGGLWVRREVTPLFPEGTHWQSISVGCTAGELLAQLAIASKAITSNVGKEKVSKGSTPSLTSGSSSICFRNVSASCLDGGSIWAVTVTGLVCRRHGVTRSNPAGTHWLPGIAGNWKYISSRGFVSCCNKFLEDLSESI